MTAAAHTRLRVGYGGGYDSGPIGPGGNEGGRSSSRDLERRNPVLKTNQYKKYV